MCTGRVLILLAFSAISAADLEGITTITNCGEIEPPEFGDVTFKSGESVKQQAVFSCTPGYVLEGASTLDCLGEEWSGDIPLCKLAIFGRTTNSSNEGYKFVNDATNHNMWQIEESQEQDNGSIKITREEAPSALLHCHPPFCSNQSSTAKPKRFPKQEIILHSPQHRLARREAAKTKSTRLVLDIPRPRRQAPGDPKTIVSVDHFEIGPFVKSPSVSFLKFSVHGDPDAILQELVVYAHCLPDPPGHLDPLASNGYGTVTLNVSDGDPSHTKCLQLKDRIDYCDEFALRFSLYILHDVSKHIAVTFTPKGIFSTLSDSLCSAQDLLNP